MMNPSNGKGSKQRKTDKKKYNDEYDRIFGKKENKDEQKANDLSHTPNRITALNSDLASRMKTLVSDVDIDLDSPLADEDDRIFGKKENKDGYNSSNDNGGA